MEFGDRAFGAAMDYGELLPRRARRFVSLALVMTIVLAPGTATQFLTHYAERQATQFSQILKRALPAAEPPSRSPTSSSQR